MSEQKPVTFGKVCKVALKRWKLFLIVGVVATAACTVGITFGLNKAIGRYEANFTYNSSDLKSGLYCDGSYFYYAKMCSKENLENVKASDPDFASIDIDKMVRKSGISVSETITPLTTTKNAYSYTVSAKVKYFANKDQAKKFIDAVVSYPLDVDRSVAVASSFDTNLDLYDVADTYEEQLAYLEGQANTLDGYYLSLKYPLNPEDAVTIGSTAASLIESNSVQIANIVGAQHVDWTDEGRPIASTERANITTLKALIHKWGFVKNYESFDYLTLDTQKEALTAEKASNDAKITAIKDAIGSTSASSEELAVLAARNAEIEFDLETIAKKQYYATESNRDAAWNTAYDSFKNTLSSYRKGLAGCVDSYVVLLNKMYIEGADVAYSSTNIIDEKRSLTIVPAVLVSLVVGIVVAGAVNVIIDRKKLYE